MKKITFALMALLAFSFSLRAQQYVSTEPSNRNAIIEEFTGRTCPYCPDGHLVSHQILEANPGRVWSVAYHAQSSLSPTTYPNLNTSISATIENAFAANSLPSAVINRSTAQIISRNQWASYTNAQLNQAAECNVAGFVAVNPQTRVATVTVEVYYTGNSAADENYLTIAMTQDSIIGSQSGASSNPGQVINGQYVHLHVFRDMITPTWGDAISPTTQGTLVTRTYSYTIPESIGSPNGVEVDLNNIHFVAWVSERYQGTPTRPILNVCELTMAYGSNEPIYPAVMGVMQSGGNTCTHMKDVEINIQNLGVETITSLTVEVEMEGQTQTIHWNGELPQFNGEKIIAVMDVPFGTHTVNATITEANGEPYTNQGSGTVSCVEWSDVEVEGEEETLSIHIMQDKFGNQTTWDLVDGNMNVIASGGPYTTLAGGNSTMLHVESATVPANECVTFTIYDAIGNGINCGYGEGYYKIFDSNNNLLVESNGVFGASASHVLSIINPVTIQVATVNVRLLGYNEAIFSGSLMGDADEVGFVYRMVTSSDQTTVEGELTGDVFVATVNDLVPSSIYVVRAYAVAHGTTVYGEELTFNTWTLAVSDLEQSLKIYPNPTSGVLNVEASDLRSVAVYNSLGQLVLTKEAQGGNVQLGVDGLENGIYFLRVTSQTGEVLNRTFSVAH